MNNDLDEALKDFKPRRQRARVKLPRERWSENIEVTPEAVIKLAEAVRKKRLVIGQEYYSMEINKAMHLKTGHQPLNVPILQFDLAIWRSPVKLVEAYTRGSRPRFRVELR